MYRDCCDLTAQQTKVVEEVTDELESLLQHDQIYGDSFRFSQSLHPNSRNRMLKSGFNICGAYETQHYPFCVYMGIHLFKRLAEHLIGRMGFKRHTINNGTSAGCMSY